jgi:hypothetical protein
MQLVMTSFDFRRKRLIRAPGDAGGDFFGGAGKFEPTLGHLESGIIDTDMRAATSRCCSFSAQFSEVVWPVQGILYL